MEKVRETFYTNDKNKESDYIRKEKARWNSWIEKEEYEAIPTRYEITFPKTYDTPRKKSVRIDKKQFMYFVHFVLSQYVIDKMLIETYDDKYLDTEAVEKFRQERLGVGIYSHDYDDG